MQAIVASTEYTSSQDDNVKRSIALIKYRQRGFKRVINYTYILHYVFMRTSLYPQK